MEAWVIWANCSSLMAIPNSSMAACCCAMSACRPMSVLINAPVMSAGTAIVSASIPNHVGVASTASNVGRGDQITPRVRWRKPGSAGPSERFGDVIVLSRLGHP